MLLEMESSEVLNLLESPEQLQSRVAAAFGVLRAVGLADDRGHPLRSSGAD